LTCAKTLYGQDLNSGQDFSAPRQDGLVQYLPTSYAHGQVIVLIHRGIQPGRANVILYAAISLCLLLQEKQARLWRTPGWRFGAWS